MFMQLLGVWYNITYVHEMSNQTSGFIFLLVSVMSTRNQNDNIVRNMGLPVKQEMSVWNRIKYFFLIKRIEGVFRLMCSMPTLQLDKRKKTWAIISCTVFFTSVKPSLFEMWSFRSRSNRWRVSYISFTYSNRIATFSQQVCILRGLKPRRL